MRKKLLHAIALLLAASLALSACEGVKREEGYPVDPGDARREKRGSMTGEGGFKILGGEKKVVVASGIGVNSFLWRAALDTISFMPLASVDPQGGVIITDWYENPDARGERFKINIIIMGAELRSDGVRASVFKQVAKGNGWQDAKTSGGVPRDLENKILTRARELRIKSE